MSGGEWRVGSSHTHLVGPNEKWSGYFDQATEGLRLVDVREYLDGRPGSRFVCEATPEDAARIVADRARVLELEAALAPIMAYLTGALLMANPDGLRRGDVLAKCNDLELRASDVQRLQAALGAAAPAGREGA